MTTDSSSGYLHRSVTNTIESSATINSRHVQSSTGYACLNSNRPNWSNNEHHYLIIDQDRKPASQNMELDGRTSSLSEFIFKKKQTTPLTSLNPVDSDDPCNFLNISDYRDLNKTSKNFIKKN